MRCRNRLTIASEGPACRPGDCPNATAKALLACSRLGPLRVIKWFDRTRSGDDRALATTADHHATPDLHLPCCAGFRADAAGRAVGCGGPVGASVGGRGA